MYRPEQPSPIAEAWNELANDKRKEKQVGKATIEELLTQVIGMDYHEAMEITESCGFIARVVMKDKQPRPVSDEENEQRLNFVVVDDLVTVAGIG